jgi:FtsH-binding integral membrane protein
LWYVLSAALLFWSAHHLSRALEDTAPEPPPTAAQRRFWWTRGWPVWICMPAIGSTLVKGQSNMLVLALLTGFIAAAIRGRRAVAGWWLAGAVCIKVFPALLVVYPLARRDWRMLGHFTLALVAGLVVVPVVALGSDRAWVTTETFVGQILLPGLTTAPGVMSRELTDMTGTDNQSIRAIIHNALNFDGATRPPMASTGTKIAHALIALGMIVWTFWATRRISDERYRTLFVLSGLVIVAVAVTPVNHTHYMVLAFPAVLGLVFWEWERRKKLIWGAALTLVVVFHIVSGIYPRLPFLPGYQAARDLGLTMFGALLVWWAGLRFPAAGAPRPANGAVTDAGTIRLPSVRVFK